MVVSSATIDSLLKEREQYPPSAACRKSAHLKNDTFRQGAAKDPGAFWSRMAKELDWIAPWSKVLEWNPPFAKWFLDGKLNVSANCLDRHLAGPRRNKAALVWEGEPGERRVLTYHDMWREVSRFANVLKGLGVKRGDRVTIYMPMIPELPIAMLACARVGAVHSVIFGGFSARAIRDRAGDAETRVIVTADGGYRRGTVLPLKKIVDEAVAGLDVVQHVVVFKRAGIEVSMREGRDHWWHELMPKADAECEPEAMDATDPLFLLYTSGTTGKPKGIQHSTGGYLVGVATTMKYVFDLKDEDLFWCTADIGWVTGHSYIVYGPLANGASTVMYEGTPDYTDKDRFWRIVEKYGITICYTAPIAIRTFMKWGEEYPKRCDLSSLRLLGSVGEPINPEAWVWYWKVIGGGRCPVVDTWWQTEAGHILITPLQGITTLKPGSATLPFPGVDAEVLDEKGNPAKSGYLVLRKPWPGMLRGIWGDPDRFVKQYWSKYDNIYFTGDGAKRDEDGYFWLLGRVDDVMNVSGHRVSTMEVESALVDHKAVAEAAVIGKPHDIKGQAIAAFVTLKQSVQATPGLQDELKQHVVKKIGALARPDDVIFSAEIGRA